MFDTFVNANNITDTYVFLLNGQTLELLLTYTLEHEHILTVNKI